MKKINWSKVAEFIAKTIAISITILVGGFAFFMLFNMFRELIRNW
jgi:hypothetical protein